MEGERQLQDMLEIRTEHGMTTAMRKPVGVECYERAA
jgi:hypothetical protein